MPLGQIVAISFAQNLFFATILVSRRPRPTDNITRDEEDAQDPIAAWSPPLYAEALLVAISLISTVMVPTIAHTKYFMLILLVPYLLPFVPPSRSSASGTSAQKHGEEANLQPYVTFVQWYAMACVVIQAHSTFLVL